MDKERFAKQLAFILEADKEKEIYRQTHITGYKRQENDAEHAWHMAMMIYLLKEYANEEFDLAKTMMMALIHDIVEIDAGDTYAYDAQALATQTEREAKAAERIFGLLPEEQKAEMISLFNEFEACETPESKFAHAMDNFQPLLLNDANNGGDWRAHVVKKSQVKKRQIKTAKGSKDIWEYTKKLIEKNVENGNIINDD
ncbi:MAG: HD domain-containing protein [Clostridia bacterium]|nr:HD domain-containing protein [Clostridia bacterium]